MTGTWRGVEFEDMMTAVSSSSSMITDPLRARVEGLSSSVSAVHGRAARASDVLAWYELENMVVTTVAGDARIFGSARRSRGMGGGET